MKDPVNQKLYKKGMELLSTSTSVEQALHGRFCNRNHEHQTLEGTTHVHGQSVSRTSYSENYPRKFARLVAKCLVKFHGNRSERQAYDEALAAINRAFKRDSNGDQNSPAKRAKLTHQPLIEPQMMPAKRRRLATKTAETTSQSNQATLATQIRDLILPGMPRVGRSVIQDQEIINRIQELFDDKKVITVVARKGTERTIKPPKSLDPEQAPYRRAIIVQRKTRKVMVEQGWEDWRHLSERQLLRRSHAACQFPEYNSFCLQSLRH